jgi:hypothetical protein
MKMRTRRKKSKKRIGTSLLLCLIALLSQAEAGKKKDAVESYAVVAGTVFRDPGFALPEATVTLIPNQAPSGTAIKVKKMQAACNSRGEFVFHVPPANMRYTVKAAAKGYHEEEKPVEVRGEERVEVTFSLHEESK